MLTRWPACVPTTNRTELDEAREKLRLGMHMLVREGSTERNLRAHHLARHAAKLGELFLRHGRQTGRRSGA